MSDNDANDTESEVHEVRRTVVVEEVGKSSGGQNLPMIAIVLVIALAIVGYIFWSR